VVSLNNYAMAPDKKLLQRLHQATGKPLLLGEFHMGAPEGGMHTGLVGVKNQAARGQAYAHYMEQAASIPYCVGAHWFQYVDQPVLGRFDGENYNIGFVDVTDRPYPALSAAAQACNLRLKEIHAGTLKPRTPAPQAVSSGYLW
jgi:hypothetical protein